MGESITTGMLSSWEVKSGSIVAADEVVGAIETDKVRKYVFICIHVDPWLLIIHKVTYIHVYIVAADEVVGAIETDKVLEYR
jgi:hypothetical protein